MKKSKRDSKILSGAIWLGLSAIFLKIIGLIYKIPMSYVLTDEGMGYFNSAYTIYTFFYIIGSAGIPKAISILCAKADSRGADKILSVSFKFFSLLGIILSLGLFLFAERLCILFATRKSLLTVIAISPTVFFITASGVMRGYFNGILKFMPIAVSELIGGICKLFLGLLFAYYALNRGFDIEVISAFSILGITIGSILGFFFLCIYYKSLKIKSDKGYINGKGMIKSILRIALPITLSSALTGIVNMIDLSVIVKGLINSSYNETLASVLYGNYTTLSIPMLSMVSTLIAPISLSSIPHLSKLYAEKRFAEAGDTVDLSIYISSIISVPAFFLFMFFPLQVLSLIFEESSAVLGFSFLMCLSPSVFIIGLLIPLNTLLESVERVDLTLISLSTGAIIKLIFGVIFIGMDNVGVLSAPIGTSISYFVSLLLTLFFIKRFKGIKFNLLMILPALICAIIAFLITVTIKIFLFDAYFSRTESFMILLCFGIVYLSLIGVHFIYKFYNGKINKKQHI